MCEIFAIQNTTQPSQAHGNHPKWPKLFVASLRQRMFPSLRLLTPTRFDRPLPPSRPTARSCHEGHGQKPGRALGASDRSGRVGRGDRHRFREKAELLGKLLRAERCVYVCMCMYVYIYRHTVYRDREREIITIMYNM